MDFKPVKATASECHVYVNGICLTWYHYETPQQEELVNETIQTPTETMGETATQTTEFSLRFLTLAFQLFGIVVLFILLVVMIEELANSSA